MDVMSNRNPEGEKRRTLPPAMQSGNNNHGNFLPRNGFELYGDSS
jgi:hypothetical protein